MAEYPHYAIKGEDLDDLADIARAKTLTTSDKTVEQMKTIFAQRDDELLQEQLRASLTANVGGLSDDYYDNRTLAQILGTAPDYGQGGVLYSIRYWIWQLYQSISENLSEVNPRTIYDSFMGIRTALDSFKAITVNAINSTYADELETPLKATDGWQTIQNVIDNLGNLSSASINSAVNSASDELRTDVDNLITALRTQYDLDFEYVTGNWDATLDSIGYLCEALASLAQPPVIQPLSVTANGTYTAPSGVDGYSPVTVNTDPEKGVVFGDFDSNGFPHSVRIVGMTKIPDFFFADYSSSYRNMFGFITDVIIPNHVTEIGTRAFQNSKIEHISIPNSVTYVGNYAFNATNLKEFPNWNCEEIASYTFGLSEIETDVVVPSIVNKIGPQAFFSVQKAKSVTFLNTNITLGEQAFHNFGLNNQEIPVEFAGDVTAVPRRCFYAVPCVEYDFSHATFVPPLYSLESLGHKNGCVIKVPQSLLSEWQNATNWADLTDVEWQGV